jgi:hypothetical protein
VPREAAPRALWIFVFRTRFHSRFCRIRSRLAFAPRHIPIS